MNTYGTRCGMRPKSSIDIPVEDFQKILYEGFWYEEGKNAYYERNAIFIGNGYQDHMVRTHPQGIPEFADGDGPATKDRHYWDWGKRDGVFSFEDYGITWSVRREDLK